MDETPRLSKDLSHLARLALKGQQRDIQIFIRRLTKRYGSLEPELANELGALLRQSPASPSPSPLLRKVATEMVPVDLDSRLSLARSEDPVHLDWAPEWTESIGAALRQLVDERRHKDVLAAAGLQPTRTALFTGAPGTGKTLAARWVAEALQRPLVTLDLAAVMSSFLGRTGNNVRNVLDYAKSVSCVFFLDEFDAIAKRRDDIVEVGELKRLVTVLLQEIDTWPTTGLLIAATNHHELLDPAVWRRFETIVPFEMPTHADVRRTIEFFLKDADTTEQLLKVLARALVGLSYADIDTLIKRARRQAVIQGQPLPAKLRDAVTERTATLNRKERAALALDLMKMGFSQREANHWTGVSRDTIRKHDIQQ